MSDDSEFPNSNQEYFAKELTPNQEAFHYWALQNGAPNLKSPAEQAAFRLGIKAAGLNARWRKRVADDPDIDFLPYVMETVDVSFPTAAETGAFEAGVAFNRLYGKYQASGTQAERIERYLTQIGE
jgi:hypothetical protein